MIITNILGHLYTGAACCRPCHPSFDPSVFFLGCLGETDTPIVTDESSANSEQLRRPPSNEKILQETLIRWRNSLATTSHSIIRPSSWILDLKSIKTIARIHPDRLTCAADITTAIKAGPKFCEQYGEQLWSIVMQHGTDHPIRRRSKRERKDMKNSSSDARWETEQDIVMGL
jgi:hypothetical protein